MVSRHSLTIESRPDHAARRLRRQRGVGSQLVQQALAAGDEVVATVRDPARLAATAHPRLRVITADVMDPSAIAGAVVGADAAVSALGPRGRGPTRVCADGVRSILAAMDKAGVRRLVVVSANGAFYERGDGVFTRLVVKPILQRALRESFTDAREMEAEVRGSDTDWTIIRPPRLTNGPRRGRYRAAVDAHAGITISRADVADAVLRALHDPATSGHMLGVGY